MKIKISLVIFLWLNTNVLAQVDQLISLDLADKNPALIEVLDQIAVQTDYTFSYSSTAIPIDEKVELKAMKGTVMEILADALKNFPISYNIINDQIILKFSDLRQTVRGTLIDTDTNQPIIGATVVLENSTPLKGTISDTFGNFRLENIPVGRRSFRVDYLGYKTRFISNILIGSGKEVVLNIQMEESSIKMQEIIVQSAGISSNPVNEMAQVSARSFTVEETKRFPISIGDPLRLASSFAGVSGTDSESNEIIIRGNTPRGILWKLEGVEIPSPNHFSAEGAASGGISMFSTQVISRSDFYTGAFAPEYGNATSGVFDVHLRNGNNEKRENTIQAGFLGLDLAFEGPFAKGAKSSYLFNYRYSTLGILDALGLNVQDENEENIFQDLSLKLNFPTDKMGTFSVFGLGGLSSFTENIGTIISDEESYDMGVIGLSHNFLINKSAFLKTTVSYSKTRSLDNFIESDEDPFENTSNFQKSYLRLSTQINKKFNAKHTVESGLTYSALSFTFFETFKNPLNQFPFNSFDRFDDEGNSSSQQGFISWKYKINNELTLVNGVHALRFDLTGETSIEPRSSIKWQFRPNQSLFAGFGIHSRVESLEYYLGNFINQDGSTVDHNKDLGLTKSSHYVFGYESNLTDKLYFKSEIYYQRLFNVPVFVNETDNAFSTINLSDGYTADPLVNEGSGANYGLELSLERKFSDGYFFMLNSSFYDAKYTALDGIKRNSRFDGAFSHHVLAGKEYKVGRNGRNNILGFNIKLTSAGNKRYTPIDLDLSKQLNNEIRLTRNAFKDRYKDFFRIDFQINFIKNNSKSTSEWRLDIQNMTNHMNVLEDFYGRNSQSVFTEFQLGLIPVLSYRVEF